MNPFCDAMDLFAFVFDLLTRPNHGITSVAQLCKIKRIDEDLVRRNVGKVEKKYGGRPAFEVKNHRLELTAHGRRILKLALQERALAESAEEATETLTVECGPYLAELLPKVLPAFMDNFGGLVQLRICNLEAAAVRLNIIAHSTNFGLGFVQDDDARSGVESLESRITAGVAIPIGHRLQDGVGAVAGADLRADERIFIPREALTLPGLGQRLQGVASANRIECDSPNLIRRCVGLGLGLGVIFDFGGEGQRDGVTVRPIAGVEERLCFYLPRRMADLSEPARALMDEIRKHLEGLKAETPVPAEPATVSTPLPVGNGDFGGIPISASEEMNS